LTKINVNFGQNDRHSDHQVSQIRPYACILISNSLIVQFLNKKIYGIELKQGEEKQEEYLTFSNAQRDNLELHLREYLLASKQIKKPNVNVLTDTQPKL
jgi:hypothetical protein